MKKIEVDNKLNGIIDAIESAIPEDDSNKNPESSVAEILKNNGFSQDDYKYWGKYLSEKSPKWMKNYLDHNSIISITLSKYSK